MNQFCRQSGFTLLELLVSLVVLLVIVSVGVPGLQQTLQSNQISARTNLLVTSMYEARSRAVLENRKYTLCMADMTEAATTEARFNWTEGWYLVSEDDCEDSEVASEGRAEIKSLSISSNVSEITFRGDGAVRIRSDQLDNCDGDEAIYAGCFELVNAAFTRGVQVTQSGSIRSCRIDSETGACE